jgi:hypothetical protein
MATQLTTKLTRIRAHTPSNTEWKRLLAGLGKTQADDEPLPFATILRINGLDFALWCVRAEPQHERVWRLFLVWCARQVQHRLTDPRSLAALDVAEKYALGMATNDELRAAEAAAEAAAAEAAREPMRAAEWDAALAARDVARPEAWDAAAKAARATARAVAWAGEWHAAWHAQAAEFLRLVGGGSYGR